MKYNLWLVRELRVELRRALLDAIAASMRLEAAWWLWRRWLNWLTHGGSGSRIVIMMIL